MSSLDSPREENLVPTADSANNLTSRDVQGNKSDAAVTTVGTTKSLMAYLKGVVNQVASLLTGQTDIKGTSFVKDTHSLKNIKDLVDAVNTALTFQQQADSTLSQVTPTENVDYPILATTLKCLVEMVYVKVQTTGETIIVTAVIDGVTYTGSVAAVADTPYFVIWNFGASANTIALTTTPSSWSLMRRSVAITVKKSTTNGTGTILGRCVFAKR